MDFISGRNEDKTEMLRTIGAASIESLLCAIPKSLRSFSIEIPEALSAIDLERETKRIAASNADFDRWACYLGAGVYDHFVHPATESLAHRSEFITAYTPYQGEASQGALQAIYEYQSLICELTAMDCSNASMYDGASALAEAAVLALRGTERKKILLSAAVHPDSRAVLKTYLSFFDAEVVEVPVTGCVTDLGRLESLADEKTAAIIFQQPNFFGAIEEAGLISEAAHRPGALLIASVNPVSLGVLAPPGEYGADIAVGDGQPLGNRVAFGGPHFGFFAVRDSFLRKMPGRIAGMTVDHEGRRAFVLTLQAREQHIRREKATSNICTNHALGALKGAIQLCLLGKEGLKRLSLLNVHKAHQVYRRLLKIKGVFPVGTHPFFNEFVLEIKKDPAALHKKMAAQRIIGPLALGPLDASRRGQYLFAVTEKRTEEELSRLVRSLEDA